MLYHAELHQARTAELLREAEQARLARAAYSQRRRSHTADGERRRRHARPGRRWLASWIPWPGRDRRPELPARSERPAAVPGAGVPGAGVPDAGVPGAGVPDAGMFIPGPRRSVSTRS
jgi:hypothetical protein